MTNSLLHWHLFRDNPLTLSRFCDKNQISREISDYILVNGVQTFHMTTHFDNGGFVKAELVRGICNCEHYQVISYDLGN